MKLFIRGKSNKPIALEPTQEWIIVVPCSMDNERNVRNVDSHFLFVTQMQ